MADKSEVSLNKSDTHAEGRTNLIINYLPQSMTDKELYSMFMTIGPLKNCRIMKDYKTGYSYGFGFVEYQRIEDAALAIQTLNGLQVMNKKIKVSYARPPSESIKDTNLYVTGLPRNITQTELEKLFSKYGKIVQSNLLKDKLTGMPRGVAFVRFDQKSEAQAAIQGLHNSSVEGGIESLVVKIAEEHGKHKASFYTGWESGFNKQSQLSSIRMLESRDLFGTTRSTFRNRDLMLNKSSWMSENGIGIMRSSLQGGLGAIRQERFSSRYNPMGLSGSNSICNWN